MMREILLWLCNRLGHEKEMTDRRRRIGKRDDVEKSFFDLYTDVDGFGVGDGDGSVKSRRRDKGKQKRKQINSQDDQYQPNVIDCPDASVSQSVTHMCNDQNVNGHRRGVQWPTRSCHTHGADLRRFFLLIQK